MRDAHEPRVDRPHPHRRTVARSLTLAALLAPVAAVVPYPTPAGAVAIDPACHGVDEGALTGVAPVPFPERWEAHFVDGGEQCDDIGPDHGGTSGADGVDAMDFDGDCDIDVVTGWEESGKVFVYLNPLFTTPPSAGCPSRYWPTTETHEPPPGLQLATAEQWPLTEITRQDTNDAAPFKGVEDAVFGDRDGDGVADFVVISTEVGRMEIFVSVPTRADSGWTWHTFKLTGEENYMRAVVSDLDLDGCPDIVAGSKEVDTPSSPTGDIRWWRCDAVVWHPDDWRDAPSPIPSNDAMRDMWGSHHLIASNMYWIMEMEVVDLSKTFYPYEMQVEGGTETVFRNYPEIQFTDRQRVGYMFFEGGDITQKDNWRPVVIDNPDDADEPFRWSHLTQLVDSDADGNWAIDDPLDPPELVVAYDANAARGVFARWYELQGGAWQRREVVIDGGTLPWDAIANKAVAVADVDGDGRQELIGTIRGHDYSGVFALRPEGGFPPRCFESCSAAQEWTVSRIAPYYSRAQGEIKYDNLAIFDADLDCDVDVFTVEENGVGGKGLGTVWYENPLAQGPANPVCAISPVNHPPTISGPSSIGVDEHGTATALFGVTDTDLDPSTLKAQLGTVERMGNAQWRWSLDVGDGPSQINLALIAIDLRGAITLHPLTVNVRNLPPVIHGVSATSPIDEGSTTKVTIDASDAYDPVRYAFDCDGNGSFEIGPQAASSHDCRIPDDGVLRINVRVSDDTDGVLGSTDVTVRNVVPVLDAPHVVALGGAPVEGGPIELRVDFTDPGADDFSCVVDYGDGSPAANGHVNVSSSGRHTCLGDLHRYPDEGTYTASVAVSDGDAPAQTATATTSVANIAPAVGSPRLSVTRPDLNQPVAVDAAFSDPAGAADAPYSCTVDFGDGDGPAAGVATTSTCTATGSHRYLEEGDYTVAVVVADDVGAAGSNSVVARVENVPPVVAPPVMTRPVVDEGAPVRATATFADGGDNGPYTCTVDYGAGAGAQPATVMGSTCTGPSTVYLDDGTHAVTIRVADADGVAGSAQRSVAVRNVAPVVTASGSSIDEGGVATVSGTITDPGALDTFTLAVEWGDGTTATVQYPAGTTSFDLDHRYLDDDPTATAHDVVAVTIGVIDDDLGVGNASTAVSVTNVAPTAIFELIADEAGMSVGPAPPSDVEVLLAGLIGTIAVRFADVGTRDAHHATIDWGDGSRWQGAVLGSVSDTHAYAQPGRYAIAVTVVDDDTGSVTVGRTVEVVDAEGAVANVIGRVRRALADPTIDPTVAVRLRAALVVLEGNADGLARNGALDHLELTAWSAALVGIRDAVITLQDAGWDGAASQLTLAAKALVLELIASAERSATTPTASAAVAAARGWVAVADASTDLVAKLNALQLALNALRPAMS